MRNEPGHKLRDSANNQRGVLKRFENYNESRQRHITLEVFLPGSEQEITIKQFLVRDTKFSS